MVSINIDINNQITYKYVVDVYNTIATHFDITRAYTWNSVKKFVNNLSPYSSILEIGSGNGKNLQIRDDLIKIGIDLSSEMVKITNHKQINSCLADCQWLPFKNNIFESSISVAVIHHIPNKEGRLRSLSEQIRVTKMGGQLLIQAWSVSAIKNYKPDKFIVFNNNPDDYLVKWEKPNGERLYRFYHLFSKLEFTELITSYAHLYDNFTILEEYNNWVAIINLL